MNKDWITAKDDSAQQECGRSWRAELRLTITSHTQLFPVGASQNQVVTANERVSSNEKCKDLKNVVIQAYWKQLTSIDWLIYFKNKENYCNVGSASAPRNSLDVFILVFCSFDPAVVLQKGGLACKYICIYICIIKDSETTSESETTTNWHPVKWWQNSTSVYLFKHW